MGKSGVVGGMLQPGLVSLVLLVACYSQGGNVWRCLWYVTASVAVFCCWGHGTARVEKWPCAGTLACQMKKKNDLQ